MLSTPILSPHGIPELWQYWDRCLLCNFFISSTLRLTPLGISDVEAGCNGDSQF